MLASGVATLMGTQGQALNFAVPAGRVSALSPQKGRTLAEWTTGGREAEVEELIQAEAQDGHDLGIEPADAALREMFDEMIEAALPPQRSRDDLRGK